MKNRSVGKIIIGYVPFVLSLFLCIGIKLIFPACGPMEDGSFMRCHWAEQAVFAVSISLSIMSLIMIIVRETKIRMGISLAMIPSAISCAIIPGTLIGLCMKADMECQAVMKPAVIILSILIAASAVLNIFVNKKEE